MEVLVYDVHGNLPALEAVLNDAEGASLVGRAGAKVNSGIGAFGEWFDGRRG